MATTKKSLTARLAAGVGAAALATMTVLGGALPASAAPDNIDPDAMGSITVHKFEEPQTPSGLPNDGTELPDTSTLTALPGVEFTVRQVQGIDLSTNAGWEAADALTPDAAAAGPLGTPAVQTTDGNGQAVFANLPVGVYLVTETGHGSHNVVTEAAPFLVSIPLPVDSDWLYDVHVYPKNAVVNDVEKSVDDSAAHGLGDDVTWTIKADVPEVAAGDQLASFIIDDTLDSRLGYVSATVTGENVSLDASDYEVATNGQLVSVTFTDAGLAKLAAADNASVSVQLVTTVHTLGDGIIANTATVYINDATKQGPGFTSEAVTTNWGTIAIRKHETGDESAVLGGAEFQVFATEADAQALTNPIAIDGATTFTSDATTGIAFMPGLRAGDYWIVETKAPAGYELDATPIPYTVVGGDVDPASVDVNVANAIVPAYALPITGGSGQAAFMIGGFGLIAGAVGFALIRRRKAKAQA